MLANCPSTPAFPEAARIRELARVRLLLGNLWLSARRPVLADVCFSIAASGTAAAAVAVDTQSGSLTLLPVAMRQPALLKSHNFLSIVLLVVFSFLLCFDSFCRGVLTVVSARVAEHTAEETEIVRLHTNALGGVGFSRRWFGDDEGAVTVYRCFNPPSLPLLTYAAHGSAAFRSAIAVHTRVLGPTCELC